MIERTINLGQQKFTTARKSGNIILTTEVYMRVDMQVDICVFKVLHSARTVLVNFGRVKTSISSGYVGKFHKLTTFPTILAPKMTAFFRYVGNLVPVVN